MVDVLLVEDDRSLRELMTLVFRDEGFTVRDTTTAAEALQAVAEGKPEVMVIDVSLPGSDGAALCRTIKGAAETSGIRCLLWSSVPNLAKLARASGADAWMLKPTDLDLLVMKIRELASGRGVT